MLITRINIRQTVYAALGGFLMLVACFGLSACSEDISKDNFAIATEETASDYFANNPDKFSCIKAIFDRVRLGDADNASSLTSVLSSRGNYTIFAPNDSAVNAYMQSLGVTNLDELSYEQAQLIANSCIIDNIDEAPYETSDFPTPGSFAIPNLNDRLLTCSFETEDGGDSYYLINGESKVLLSDIEVSNAMIHEVNTVIAPSDEMLPDMIAAADNMKIMAYLLRQTTWADSMLVDRDLEYEEIQHDETFNQTGVVGGPFNVPQRRYIGYTAFVEPDEVYEQEWGINLATDAEGNVTNWDDVMQVISQHCQAVYGQEDVDDLTSPDNAVNRFVAYHLLYGKMAYDRFVLHYNEYNYKYGDTRNPQTAQMPTNVWDYYTTLGRYRGLMKITQVGDAGFEQDLDHKIYINRISIYDNDRHGDYSELGVTDAGVLISPDNGEFDNNAQNGFYYPINKILLYSNEVRNNLGSERLRIDLCTMLPEVASNNTRGGHYTYYPKGFFDNIMLESNETNMLYLTHGWSGTAGTWNDYQGDEWLFTGLYDFVLRLPPVPKDGTYELRMGVAMNPNRGMVQIYFGNDPLRLAPAGLPYDQRQQVSESNPDIPWVADVEDDAVNAENDKNMRNLGYLKGPQYFTMTNGQADTPVRMRGGSAAAIRRIITVQEMRADETYYLRFKSALRKTDAQFFLDYFEFVPTQVYNGPQPEDIW